MIRIVPTISRPHTYPARESERDLLLRRAREAQTAERREGRRGLLRGVRRRLR
jgi:hypothetical protein